MARCNEHGVYEADETLELPRAVKGWCGMGLADIKLANLGTHWIWATGFQMHSGDFWGCASPLSDHEPTPHSNHRASSREEAIKAASAELRKHMSKRAAKGDSDARAVMAWLDTLIPDQLDLFGSAA